ncbi:MAG: DMT family transporter [Chromatiales bacterium]|nr:DMT family transporter [Chromatiales bacterium]
MSDFYIAVALSLGAAFVFAIGAQLSRLGLRTTDPQTGAMVSIGSATVLYWAVAPWYLEAHFWQSSAVWLFALVGLFRPAISSTCAMAGTAILGPTISTTLSATAPLFGLIFGVALLGEALSAPVFAGTVGIVFGVAILARQGGDKKEFNWPLWALGLPILAALIRVCAHLLTKIGMEDLPSPYFAGLIAYNASMAMALGNLLRRRQNPIKVLKAPGAPWFMATGVLFGIAVLGVNIALRFGPLSVVAPLVSLEAIFVLFLGITVFREQHMNLRITAAVLLVVAGAVAISARG